MIPAPALRIECPHCGGVKELLQLISGNTFSSTMWSDTKTVYPMLPRNSGVQRCPHCGRYFFLEDAPTLPSSEKYSHETGELNFEESIEAMMYLYDESDEDRRFTLRIYVVYAYNDKYGRVSDETPTDIEAMLFKNNCLKLAGMTMTEGTFKAELYREAGEFQLCIDTLDSLSPTEEFEMKVRDLIREHAENKDAKVFKIVDE